VGTRPPRSSLFLWLWSLPLAIFLATAAGSLGPLKTVVCGTGHLLDRLVQAYVHTNIRGPRAPGSPDECSVPSETAWLMAAVVFVAVLVIARSLARHQRRVVDQPNPLEDRVGG